MYFMYVIYPVILFVRMLYVVCIVGIIVWHRTAFNYTAVYSQVLQSYTRP